MVARVSITAIDRAAAEDRLAVCVAMAGALPLPLCIARTAIRDVGAGLRPGRVVEDIAIRVVRRDPANHLICGAVHRTGPVSFDLAPCAPVVVTELFMVRMARARLVNGVARLIVRQIPVGQAIRSERRQVAVLLVVSAGDGASVRFRLAPAVTPLIRALLLKLLIARTSRRAWGAELLVVLRSERRLVFIPRCES